MELLFESELTEAQKIKIFIDARNQFTRHDHNLSDRSPETRDSCGACTLNGYHPRGEARNQINYAGWARIYVQALKPIPSNLFLAFMAELASDNRVYADALRRDIKAFGIRATGRGQTKFKALVDEVCGVYS